MSHFTVMVIGENPEKQLAPFQENNMGDCPKEYMEFEEDEDANVDTETGKRGYWRNPNSKWDWFVLGGRWTGFLKAIEFELSEVGRPGIMTSPAESGWCDQTEKGNIDFEHMRNFEGEKAGNKFDLAMSIIGHLPKNKTWEEMRDTNNIDKSKTDYWNQPRTKAWNENPRKYDDFSFRESPDEFLISREQYIQNARNSAIQTHAVIKDGKWYERGHMGWWAMVSDEKDETQWNVEFSKLLDGLPDNTLISIYDCHI